MKINFKLSKSARFGIVTWIPMFLMIVSAISLIMIDVNPFLACLTGVISGTIALLIVVFKDKIDV